VGNYEEGPTPGAINLAPTPHPSFTSKDTEPIHGEPTPGGIGYVRIQVTKHKDVSIHTGVMSKQGLLSCLNKKIVPRKTLHSTVIFVCWVTLWAGQSRSIMGLSSLISWSN
jgi:hypothetical protein